MYVRFAPKNQTILGWKQEGARTSLIIPASFSPFAGGYGGSINGRRQPAAGRPHKGSCDGKREIETAGRRHRRQEHGVKKRRLTKNPSSGEIESSGAGVAGLAILDDDNLSDSVNMIGVPERAAHAKPRVSRRVQDGSSHILGVMWTQPSDSDVLLRSQPDRPL